MASDHYNSGRGKPGLNIIWVIIKQNSVGLQTLSYVLLKFALLSKSDLFFFKQLLHFLAI